MASWKIKIGVKIGRSMAAEMVGCINKAWVVWNDAYSLAPIHNFNLKKDFRDQKVTKRTSSVIINTWNNLTFSPQLACFELLVNISGSVCRCTLCKSLWIRASAKWLKCKCKMTGPGDLPALDVRVCFPWSSGLPLIKEKKKRKIYLCQKGEKWIEGFGVTKVCLTGWRAGTASEWTPWWVSSSGSSWAYMKGECMILGKL